MLSGVVNIIRALLPDWPRLLPVKFTTTPPPTVRFRLAKVRSCEAIVPTVAVAVMVFAPCTAFNAPKVSLAATSTRPVTMRVPPRMLIGMALPMRLLFCVCRLLLLLSVSVALLRLMSDVVSRLASFSSVVVPLMSSVVPP